jgi:hypothetical protein
MTAWEVGSSVPSVSTIQSVQTADFQADVKQDYSVGIFRLFCSALFVSGARCGLSAPFWRPVSACKNPVPGTGIAAGQCRWQIGNNGKSCGLKNVVRGRLHYCGFNPSTSNCWLHSAGASRNRSTPMPRGSRPSTAAITRSGARKANEMVMLTWRTLHFWRAATC